MPTQIPVPPSLPRPAALSAGYPNPDCLLSLKTLCKAHTPLRGNPWIPRFHPQPSPWMVGDRKKAGFEGP